MKTNVKMQIALINYLIVFISAQSRQQHASLPRKGSSNRNRENREPVEQGRTLDLIRPLLGLGLSSVVRPLVSLDYNAPVAPYRPSSTSGVVQSDPYYGSYGYTPHFYNRYNYYGGFPIYRPIYAGYPIHAYGGFRPQVYPVHYGGYPQYSGYGAQRPVYSNARPHLSSGLQPATYPSIATTSPTTGATTNPATNSAQAAQIANLLGQLLGQQLRPLLNQGTAATSHNDPGIAPSYLEGKRYRGRYNRV